MEEVKKQNTELTKYSEASNTSSGTFGNQSNWSKQEFYSPRPDYDYSRFKKSKREWFGEFIGIGIFAFICNFLIKACFVLALCLICVPMNAQLRSRKPNVRTYLQHLPPEVKKESAKEFMKPYLKKEKSKGHQQTKAGNSKSKVKSIALPVISFSKIQSPLIQVQLPPIPIHKDHVLPQPKPEDINNGKQLFDSALFYISRRDTLNYISYIKRSASVQYSKAIYFWGLSIMEGVGVRQNTAIGFSYVNRASEMSCSEATYYIGQLYDLGKYGCKKDSVMALRYYEKSAEQGDFDGAVDVGYRYYNDGDTISAIKYWKQAYDLKRYSLLIDKEKNILAQIAYNLGYFSSLDSHKEIETRNYFKTSAEFGYPDGQAQYGNCCMLGYGMEKDSVEAVYWYKNAAQQRHVGAMCALPFLYYDAHENDSTILWGTKPECRDSADIQFIVGAAYYVKEDYENAEEWWKKAATQKYPDALWWMYYLCEVHKNDSVLAFEYLKQAVDAKYPEALNEMGCNYANGDMVGKDVEKAKQLFHEAGSLGFGEAYNNLGYLYSNKDCIKKPNWEIAAGYFRQGAEMNNPSAQYNYGMCLKKGKGVKKDKQAAVHWITLAAQNGDEDAIKILKGKTK